MILYKFIGLVWLLANSFIKTAAEDWKLVFKIDAEESRNEIYDLYMENQITYNINNNEAQNTTHPNGKHFKSDVINHWSVIDIDQVKVVVYRNGLERAFLDFNGTGTDKTNWFSQERLQNSSYSDLKNASHDFGYFFSVEGSDLTKRRFFINKSWGGCYVGDAGWLLVAEGQGFNCHYESIKSSTCQPLTDETDICSTPVQLSYNIYCYQLCNKTKPETNLQQKIQNLKKKLAVSKKDTNRLLWLLTDSLIITAAKDWELVFKIDAEDTNTNIYDLYMDSEVTYNINDNEAQNLTHPNGKHFKSDVINYWSVIDIDQVKVFVYQNGVERVFLDFNGTGTDKTNWFSQERLQNSSYSDLKTANHGIGYYFSIEGSQYSPRRFYANYNWGGCSRDAGWLLVSEGQTYICSYESPNKLMLLYSPTSIYMSYNEIKSWTCQPLTRLTDICSIPVQLAYNTYCYKLCNKTETQTNLQEKIQKLEKELVVSKKDTNKHKRSLISAPDNRNSSKTMGLVGTACIAVVVGILVAIDCVNICQKCSKSNKVRTEK
ncbi:unnamed protein product [Mytilus edulis]|uniref:Uncharacterized protein n=1 Tax=Mytilus edulis TaxID=6550 RepID=A0A8S3SA46_MYTED|nr:unnamed protein product [Mytilus edulis]